MGGRNIDFEWNQDLQRWEFLYLDTTGDEPRHSSVFLKWEPGREETIKALMNWFKMILRENEKIDGRS